MKAIIHDYSQCKVCDGEIPDGATYGWACNVGDPTARPTPMPSMPKPMPHFNENIPVEALQLQDVLTKMDKTKFLDFVCEWMGMAGSIRKELSYSGAILSRQGDPVHYHCSVSHKNYFDPGNLVYSVALTLLAPQLADYPWNIENRGDICESLMGVAFIAERREVSRWRHAWQPAVSCWRHAWQPEVRVMGATIVIGLGMTCDIVRGLCV